MLMKPGHGAPCNGCGLCCMDQRCPLGEAVFGVGGLCPALESRSPGWACGLVERPHAYRTALHIGSDSDLSKAAALLIGAGKGCDALLDGEVPNHHWRYWAVRSIDRCAVAAAANAWGVPCFERDC